VFQQVRPHPEERPLGRVSKDGRESMHRVHPSRRLLRKLLRMRSVFFTGSKAGDPVFRDVNDGIDRSQRTGYSAGACHRARRRRDPVAEYDGLCEAAPVFALSKFEIRHVGRRSPGRRGSFATQHSRCEFGFCRKGLSPTPEIQLAVRRQPVYNPALRCFR
jgi:hypothetical protein